MPASRADLPARDEAVAEALAPAAAQFVFLWLRLGRNAGSRTSPSGSNDKPTLFSVPCSCAFRSRPPEHGEVKVQLRARLTACTYNELHLAGLECIGSERPNPGGAGGPGPCMRPPPAPPPPPPQVLKDSWGVGRIRTGCSRPPVGRTLLPPHIRPCICGASCCPACGPSAPRHGLPGPVRGEHPPPLGGPPQVRGQCCAGQNTTATPSAERSSACLCMASKPSTLREPGGRRRREQGGEEQNGGCWESQQQLMCLHLGALQSHLTEDWTTPGPSRQRGG